MKRRDVLLMLVVSAIAMATPARAQKSAMPVV
jgi:hypothetical protein